MQLFYNPQVNQDTKVVTFDTFESKHIVKVLRRKTGDELQITNGKGLFLFATITQNDPKACSVEVSRYKKIHPTKHRLHLAVAPTKMNDRYEWFLEKATEIGVHEITPILCDRSERKTIKTERYEKVIQSAMKQSFQAYLPKLNPLTTLTEFLERDINGLLFIAHCEDSERYELKRKIAPDKPTTILIGPEGDFTKKEVKKAVTKGYLPVSMGKTRLRTETAAIVACTTVALANNG
ncbi:16S rRNA (uracil(1498)-N(3))-methyltransferase [Maribacter chungangensis]|uniref:Ribosomal RNA small subunit methyltransferase E n=1 Tax=Maribacter chungangensis TaxID=1069117 RepID=A0ABW3B774_9FLAO